MNLTRFPASNARLQIRSPDTSGSGEMVPMEYTKFKSLLRRHYELTNSPRARDLLKNWEEAALSFRRILPKDRVAEIESINEFSDFEVT